MNLKSTFVAHTIAGFAALSMSPCAFADLLVGHTAALTGPSAASTLDKQFGAQLYFDHINATGGIYGERIKVISLDDTYDPKITAQNAERLINEHNVLALFMTGGTPQSLAVVPLAEKNKIALVGPSSGAIALHQPVNPYVYNVRTSYQAESIKIVKHIVLTGVQKIGVVYQQDSFGEDGKDGVVKGLKDANIDATFYLPLDRKTPNFEGVLEAVKKTETQYIVWIGSAKAVSEGVAFLRQGGSAVQVATLSNVASASFIKEIGDHYRGVVVSQVYPADSRFDVAYVTEAKKLAAGKPLSGTALEGFTSAKVMVEAFRRAGPSPTRAKVLTALSNMKFNIGGADIDYHDKSHSGLQFAELSIIGYNKKFMR